MLTLSAEQWRMLSPYLDDALSMTGEQRASWLASLRKQEPDLVETLEVLLEEHRALLDEGFLENRSVPMPEVQSLAGQSIGVYTLVSQVGQGGMGSVWLAERRDGRFERRVAVKFLNIALMGKSGEQRFTREGRILAHLAHPHVAELYDAGVTPSGQPYLVLEYIEGQHIDAYCDERELDVEMRLFLFLDVLLSVAHAHANLVVHRDLKPSNVLVRNDGQVKLLDFGIAKLEGDAGADVSTMLTGEAGRALTPAYAAPEQLLGTALTTATDVYALGVLLYVLLTGQHPSGCNSPTPAELVKAIVEDEPVRASEVVRRSGANEPAAKIAAKRSTTPEKLSRLLRGDLETIIARALKKEPAERYSSVTAFAEDIRRFLRHEPISARPDTLLYRTAKFVRRNRAAVAFVTLAVLATSAGLVGTLMQARAARAQRDFALRQVERSEALNEFHQFLLSDAAPSGKPFTVNELLEHAEHIVTRQHAPNDPNRVRLMIAIGRQYLEQDVGESARRILEEAYKLSRGIADVSVRAQASCTLAAELARDEDLQRAEALYREGLRELPQDPGFALDRIDCLQSGIEIAGETGDIQEGITRALAAQQVLRQSPFDSQVLEMHRWTDLAKAYGSAGRDRDAVAAYEHSGALLSVLGRDETGTAITLFNNWALELDQLGRPRDAEKMYRRAIQISSTGQAEDTVSPVILCNYSKVLRELGQLDDAATYAERAYQKARKVGLPVAVNHAMLSMARTYTEQGRAARAETLYAEVEPRLRKNLPPGHFAFATLSAARALNALASGDTSDALKLADEAVSIDEAAIQAGQEGAYYLPSLLITRAQVELATAKVEQAAEDAARALDLSRATAAGSLSSIQGSAFLTLGRARQAQGRKEDARAALRSAVEHLQDAVGPTQPETRTAQRLLAALESQT